MSEPEPVQSLCNSCGQKTAHTVEAEATVSESTPVDGMPGYNTDWSEKWSLRRCRGCGAMTAYRREYFSEWDRGTYKEDYYPPRVSRPVPAWSKDLPDDIIALMDEVYAALHAGSRRLAMMGSRAMLDMMIVKKVGDVGTFQQKLKKLEDEGYLGAKNRKVLEAALDAGNAVSHRGYEPNTSVAGQVMDILENVLQSAYMDDTAKSVRAATPQRERKKKDETTD